MNFSSEIIEYYHKLNKQWKIPKAYSLINPFGNDETWALFEQFYRKYFNDQNKRIALFGINPGRFGAGVTGIPFTDPKLLEEKCEIQSSFQKRNELSAIFIYEMIDAFGGPYPFYEKFLISSLCPLGFLKDGINYNYYDAKDLQTSVEPMIIANLNEHIKMGCSSKVALCLGKGKNYKYFKKLNDNHGFFDDIIPLPHPRWVMQYRRKSKDFFVDEYIEKLALGLDLTKQS